MGVSSKITVFAGIPRPESSIQRTYRPPNPEEELIRHPGCNAIILYNRGNDRRLRIPMMMRWRFCYGTLGGGLGFGVWGWGFPLGVGWDWGFGVWTVTHTAPINDALALPCLAPRLWDPCWTRVGTRDARGLFKSESEGRLVAGTEKKQTRVFCVVTFTRADTASGICTSRHLPTHYSHPRAPAEGADTHESPGGFDCLRPDPHGPSDAKPATVSLCDSCTSFLSRDPLASGPAFSNL